ncbi:MAG: S24 family peptidase [Deltaproteobacteria bacterium]|nr:S24 family peptidase [Deltaproteobacteria bacterium]
MTRPLGPSSGMIREQLALGIRVRLRVWGTSMLPLIPPGATVVIAPASGCGPRPGDVVAIDRDGRTVCHVLVSVRRAPDGTELRTAGTSAAPDAPVDGGSLVGRIAAVEWGPLRLDTDSPAFTAVRRLAARAGPLFRLALPLLRLPRIADALRRRGAWGLAAKATLWPAEVLAGLDIRVRYEARVADVARTGGSGVGTGGSGLRVTAGPGLGPGEVVAIARSNVEGDPVLGRWRFRKGARGELFDAGLEVSPAARGRGLAADLLLAAVDATPGCQRVTATTDVLNRAARRAFARAGLRATLVSVAFRGPGGRVFVRKWRLRGDAGVGSTRP